MFRYYNYCIWDSSEKILVNDGNSIFNIEMYLINSASLDQKLWTRKVLQVLVF